MREIEHSRIVIAVAHCCARPQPSQRGAMVIAAEAIIQGPRRRESMTPSISRSPRVYRYREYYRYRLSGLLCSGDSSPCRDNNVDFPVDQLGGDFTE
jgi:hypothetical protein